MWAFATIVGIFLFLVLLLAVPVDLFFCLQKDEYFKPRVMVRWLFGLVGKDVIGRRKKEPKAEKERKRGGNIKPLLAVLRTRGFINRFFKFVRNIFRLLNIRELKLNCRVGFDDPAETGLLFAAIGPAMVFVKPLRLFDIQIEPDFDREILRGYCKGDVRVFPIRLVSTLVIFVCSPITIRAIKAVIAARRK